jgi:hypothetical protein
VIKKAAVEIGKTPCVITGKPSETIVKGEPVIKEVKQQVKQLPKINIKEIK